MAFAAKYRNTDQVAVCYFGEAAVNNGAFTRPLKWQPVEASRHLHLREQPLRHGHGLERAARSTTSPSGLSLRPWPTRCGRPGRPGDARAMERAVERAGRTNTRPCSSPPLPLHGPLDANPIHGHYRTGGSRGPAGSVTDRGVVHRLIEDGLTDQAAVKAMTRRSWRR